MELEYIVQTPHTGGVSSLMVASLCSSLLRVDGIMVQEQKQ